MRAIPGKASKQPAAKKKAATEPPPKGTEAWRLYKKAQRTKPIPPKQFTATLPSGKKVNVRIERQTETVHRRLRYEFGGEYVAAVEQGGRIVRRFVPHYKTLKKDGQPVTAAIEVPGIAIAVELEDGTKYAGRAACKPPDKFDPQLGKRLALKRLLKLDSGIDPHTRQKTNAKPKLDSEDRKYLLYAVLRDGRPRKKAKKEPAA